MEQKEDVKKRVIIWQILLLLLSVYVIIEMAVELFVKVPDDTAELLSYIDTFICILFLIDFGNNAVRDKLKYLKWGWVDLISSIPLVGPLRFGRIFRIVRVLRLLKAFKNTKSAVSAIFSDKATGAFGTVATISIFMMIFSSVAILHVEKASNSNISTPGDALWWSFVTITTVGYGDFYPVTDEGRAIAALLMLTGVGLFGTFTGFVATWFIEDEEKEQTEEMEEIRQELAEIRKILERKENA